MRNIDLPSNLKPEQSDVNLSTELRNGGEVFDEILTLKCQVAAVKKKANGGLINTARILKFIDSDFKMKLVHDLILTQIDFCNALVYELPYTVLHGLQVSLIAAVRFNVKMPRYDIDRITRGSNELHFMSVKAKNNSRYV